MDIAYLQNIWKSFPISLWSVVQYLVLSRWASKKLHSTNYRKIPWLASWADALCILGVVVLIGDTIWILLIWMRWNPINPQNPTLLILNIVRNIAMIIICPLLMSKKIRLEEYIHFNREVIILIMLNISFMILWVYLAPGMEWTNWIYALENGYACWPYVWFLSYIFARAITSLIWIKMW